MPRISNLETARRSTIRELEELYASTMARCKELLSSKKRADNCEGRQLYALLQDVKKQLDELKGIVQPKKEEPKQKPQEKDESELTLMEKLEKSAQENKSDKRSAKVFDWPTMRIDSQKIIDQTGEEVEIDTGFKFVYPEDEKTETEKPIVLKRRRRSV